MDRAHTGEVSCAVIVSSTVARSYADDSPVRTNSGVAIQQKASVEPKAESDAYIIRRPSDQVSEKAGVKSEREAGGIPGLGRADAASMAWPLLVVLGLIFLAALAVRKFMPRGMRAELNEIRQMVQELVERSDRTQYPDAPRQLVNFYSYLIGQEVEEQLAKELLQRVAKNLDVDNARLHGRVATEVVRMELKRLVGEMLPSAAPLKLTRTDRPTVVALVGPTGVGKTTTIAKLAANMKLREKKNVGLITIDSYRIAAVEQLKTYAQILKVPLLSVLKPQDMADALQRMSHLDLVLIDTAGRSQRDDMRIAELSSFLKVAQPDQIHLVLSSTSRERTTREAIDRFAPLGVTQLIFTKVDEAVGMGVMLSVLRRVKLRVSYLTHGQAVPDDIEVASASRLARLILGFNEDDAEPKRSAAPLAAGGVR